ncbi:MAG: hypothetical protein NVS2B16_07550 [Chloroflexota bacterium]
MDWSCVPENFSFVDLLRCVLEQHDLIEGQQALITELHDRLEALESDLSTSQDRVRRLEASLDTYLMTRGGHTVTSIDRLTKRS